MKPDAPGSRCVLSPLVILWAMTLTAQLLGLAYGVAQSGGSVASVILPSALVLSLVTLPLAWSGLVLGQRTGLGAPLLMDLLDKVPGAGSRFIKSALLACILGLLLGAAMVGLKLALQPYSPPEMPVLGFRGPVGGLLVSIAAAVGEEVWFRLGLMTLLVWGISRLLGQADPHPAMMWSIIILTAVAFGMAHLPQLASFDAATPFSIWGTILGNCAVGSLYGWCYWRHGLLAAMVAHFSVDLVIHVLPAFFR
ncbi:CPBP family intramembrane glutamic endopeptidase [Hyphomonas sp.]|uniref:CPBP family intramembrane glutamic endopeptidase n=1 Tax=Hyphomonas sp. TaxID=87 RepID=UPI0035284AA2